MAFRDLLAQAGWQSLADPYSTAVTEFATRSDVLGISVGPREKKKQLDWKNITLRFHVRDKKLEGEIDENEMIPRVWDGVPTDVVGCGGSAHPSELHYRTRRDRYDPLLPGVSIGALEGFSGTLGIFVEHGEAGLCILTADHVVAPPGSADGTPIYQPGLDDGPEDDRNIIGWVDEDLRRVASCGVSLFPYNGSRRTDEVPLGTHAHLRGTRVPNKGETLWKSGRTTGITAAQVVGYGEEAYDNCRPTIVLRAYDGNPECEISMGGDSGAIWYDPVTHEAVGVHCGGDEDFDLTGEWAIAAALYDLEEALGIRL